MRRPAGGYSSQKVRHQQWVVLVHYASVAETRACVIPLFCFVQTSFSCVAYEASNVVRQPDSGSSVIERKGKSVDLRSASPRTAAQLVLLGRKCWKPHKIDNFSLASASPLAAWRSQVLEHGGSPRGQPWPGSRIACVSWWRRSFACVHVATQARSGLSVCGAG
jgi:hypothetical protein